MKASFEFVATKMRAVHIGGLESGEVECGRCQAIYPLGTVHRCFASEPQPKGEVRMPFQFKITFKQGLEVKAEVIGRNDVAQNLTMGDAAEKIIETEQFLERLTGLRVHIEQVG